MRDLHNNITVHSVIDPVDHATGNTATVGHIIDRQDAEAVEYIIQAGSLADADATFAILLEEGDDSALADAATVAAVDSLGTQSGASFIFSDDNTIHKIGYIGTKRYSRLTMTPANNTGAALVSACAILHRLRMAPDSTQTGT